MQDGNKKNERPPNQASGGGFGRKLASEINPLISPCNTAETIERVSDVLRDMGLAVSIEATNGEHVLTDNFHRLSAVMVAALRFEEKELPRKR